MKICGVEKNKWQKISKVAWLNANFIIFALPNYDFGSVVQLVRMLPCHGRGRGFESRPVRLVQYQNNSKACKSLILRAFLFFTSSYYSLNRKIIVSYSVSKKK